MNKKKLIITIFIFLPILISTIILLLPRLSISFFYYPQKGESLLTPKTFGLKYEDVYFETIDKIKLNGWFIPSTHNTTKAKATIIQVHGNAGKLENHLPFIVWLVENNYNVFMFDYRGYGLSQKGVKNPLNLLNDTISAISYVKLRSDVNPDKIVILGQSLGGNNAIAAVAQGNQSGIKAMIIDSTFYSYKMIADDKLKGGNIFLSDEYSASKNIKKLSNIPIIFLHGIQDRVINYKHSKMLFNERENSGDDIILIANGQHLDALSNLECQSKILKFLDSYM